MFSRISIPVLLGGCVVLAIAVRGGPLSAESPPTQVLVLRNGNYLEGVVHTQERGYRLELKQGCEIFVRSSDVAFLARNLQDAYRYKASKIRGGVAREQIELTEWCLQNRLLPQAAHHLLEALSVDPQNPRIARLQHRLRIAAELEDAAQPTHQQPAEPGLLAAETVAATDHTSPPSQPAVPALEDLPPGALEMFSESVQPVLLNRCATAACHGDKSPSDFRIRRPTWGGLVTRHITMQNMRAAAAQVDVATPRSSRLLTAPAGPHGPLEHGMFAPRELGQYERLVRWAEFAARRPGVRPAALGEPADQQLMQHLPGRRSTLPATGTGQPSAGSTFRNQNSPPSAAPEPQRQESRPGKFPEPAKLNSGRVFPLQDQPAAVNATATDPFDPEAFNRTHHGDLSGASSENSPR